MRRRLILAAMATVATGVALALLVPGGQEEAAESVVQERVADLASDSPTDADFEAVAVGTARADVLAQFGEPLYPDWDDGCVAYRADDPNGAVWALCFEGGKLASRQFEPLY